MIYLLFAIIIMMIIALGVSVFIVFFKKKDEAEKKEKLIPTTQENLPIKQIEENMVILKSGGYRMVLEMPSINIDLMEGSEKENILQQYRKILNSFDFPFQYLQQSRTVDISEYLETLEALRLNAKSQVMGAQLNNYADYLRDLIKDSSVLTKKFYLIIPYDVAREKKHSKRNQYHAFDKNKKQIEAQKKAKEEDKEYMIQQEYIAAKKQLESRVGLVQNAFRGFDISARLLKNDDLWDLYYTCYNKDRSVYQSIKDLKPDGYTTLRVEATGYQTRQNDMEVEFGE